MNPVPYVPPSSFPPAGWASVGLEHAQAVARAGELAELLPDGHYVDEHQVDGTCFRFFAWERGVYCLRWVGAETLGDAAASGGTTLPTASIELELEEASGPDAGITQDTAYVDATTWASVQADVTNYAKSLGMDFTTLPVSAGTSYTGNLFTDGSSIKNWVANVHNQGDFATGPTSTTTDAAAAATNSSAVWWWVGVAVLIGAAVVYDAQRGRL